MIGRYFMKKQYEPGTGLGKFRNGILEPIMITGQDSMFGIGLNLQERISKPRLYKEEREGEPGPLGK